MKLQLALDLFDLETALAVTKEARDYVDIIEIGTPFLMQYGLDAVRRFRDAFPAGHRRRCACCPALL